MPASRLDSDAHAGLKASRDARGASCAPLAYPHAGHAHARRAAHADFRAGARGAAAGKGEQQPRIASLAHRRACHLRDIQDVENRRHDAHRRSPISAGEPPVSWYFDSRPSLAQFPARFLAFGARWVSYQSPATPSYFYAFSADRYVVRIDADALRCRRLRRTAWASHYHQFRYTTLTARRRILGRRRTSSAAYFDADAPMLHFEAPLHADTASLLEDKRLAARRAGDAVIF